MNRILFTQNVFYQKKIRHLFLIAVFLVLILTIPFSGCRSKTEVIKRPLGDNLLYDLADVIMQDKHLDDTLKYYRKLYKTEFVIVTTNDLESGDIDRYTQELFSRWRIGGNFDGRGILLLLDTVNGSARFEISYELEHIFTDIFCGYIIRNQIRPFWEMDAVYVGMLDATFMVSNRSKLMELDKTQVVDEVKQSDEYLSGGGGITTPVKFGAGYEKKSILNAKEREKFAAGNTPIETLEKFQYAMEHGVNDNTLDIYTPKTQVFFNYEPTRAEEYIGYAEKIMNGTPYSVKTQDNHAVVWLREDLPGRFPLFFEKTNQGWQLDWVAFLSSYGHDLSGEWVLHRIPHNYANMVPGIHRITSWCTILPVTVDETVDIRKLVSIAEKELEENHNDPQYYKKLADLYLYCNCWPIALELYSRATKVSNGSPEYLCALADTQYYLYFMKTAEKNYKKLLKKPKWRKHAKKQLREIKRFL